MLDEFISVNRVEIINRCRAKVAIRSDPPSTEAEIDHGVPMFLEQLLDELRHGPSADLDITKTATRHGHDLLLQGYTVSQVVHDYGDVCQAVTELAVERQATISTDDFRTLNRCLDDAIAGAVTEYGRAREQSSERDHAFDGAQHGALARDLLKTIHISKVAFDAIRAGRVGAAGSTGTVLSLGLDTAHDLAERLLTESVSPVAPLAPTAK
jgi:AcrR family transcriptional regulator